MPHDQVHRSRLFTATFALFSVTFFVYGSAKACGVLFEEMEALGGISEMTNGLIFSLPSAMTQLTAPVSGFLLRHHVPRRVMGTSGAILVGTGFILMGLLASKGFHFVLFSLISGFGFGFLNYSAVLSLHDAAGDSFASWLAVGCLGSYTGVTVIPYVTNFILESYGLKMTFLLYGVLCCLMIPFGLLMPNAKRNQPQIMDDLGFVEVSDEGVDKQFERGHLMKESKHPIRIPTAQNASESCNPKLSFYDQLKLFLFITAACLRRIPSVVWTLFLIPYVREFGLTVNESLLAATIGGIGGILGRCLAAVSFIIPNLHPLIPFTFYYLILGPLFCGFGVATTIFVKVVFPFSTGLFISASSAMAVGVLALLGDPEDFWWAFTIVEFGTGICSLVAGPFAGLGYQLTGSFAVMFHMNAVIYAFCFVMTVIVLGIHNCTSRDVIPQR